jgi:hypothetical protein
VTVDRKLLGYVYACTLLSSRVTPSVEENKAPVLAPVFTATLAWAIITPLISAVVPMTTFEPTLNHRGMEVLAVWVTARLMKVILAALATLRVDAIWKIQAAAGSLFPSKKTSPVRAKVPVDL